MTQSGVQTSKKSWKKQRTQNEEIKKVPENRGEKDYEG